MSLAGMIFRAAPIAEIISALIIFVVFTTCRTYIHVARVRKVTLQITYKLLFILEIEYYKFRYFKQSHYVKLILERVKNLTRNFNKDLGEFLFLTQV